MSALDFRPLPGREVDEGDELDENDGLMKLAYASASPGPIFDEKEVRDPGFILDPVASTFVVTSPLDFREPVFKYKVELTLNDVYAALFHTKKTFYGAMKANRELVQLILLCTRRYKLNDSGKTLGLVECESISNKKPFTPLCKCVRTVKPWNESVCPHIIKWIVTHGYISTAYRTYVNNTLDEKKSEALLWRIASIHCAINVVRGRYQGQSIFMFREVFHTLRYGFERLQSIGPQSVFFPPPEPAPSSE